jgi:hypothetical protein
LALQRWSLVTRLSNSPAVSFCTSSSSLWVRTQHAAELFPRAPRPALKLKLRVGNAVVGTGVDCDPWDQGRKNKSFDVARLLHNVLARKIVTTLPQHLFQNLALLRSEQIVVVANIGSGKVFVEVSAIPLHAGIIGPNSCRSDLL